MCVCVLRAAADAPVYESKMKQLRDFFLRACRYKSLVASSSPRQLVVMEGVAQRSSRSSSSTAHTLTRNPELPFSNKPGLREEFLSIIHSVVEDPRHVCGT